MGVEIISNALLTIVPTAKARILDTLTASINRQLLGQQIPCPKLMRAKDRSDGIDKDLTASQLSPISCRSSPQSIGLIIIDELLLSRVEHQFTLEDPR